MIKLTAKINLLNGSNLDGIETSSNLSKNNISSEIGAVLGARKRDINVCIIGLSKFGDGSVLAEHVDYFISDQVADDKGRFDEDITLTINGRGVSNITFEFGTATNSHPTSIRVDGVEYKDDDPIFTISNLDSTKDSHTFVFRYWNTPNSPMIITGIYSGINIDIDYRVLRGIDLPYVDRADNDKPSYGIISNSGRLVFIDSNGEIRDYAEQGLLKKGLKVQVYLRDTLSGIETQVGDLYTNDWDYDTANREVSVELKDDLEELQEINHSGLSLVVATISNKNEYNGNSGRELYEALYEATPLSYKFKKYENLDANTQWVLSNALIHKYYLNSGSLWAQWNKLAELVGAQIYKEYDGKTDFKVVDKWQS